MMQGRPSPRIKPQTESRRSMGHARNISRSIIDGHGDFRNASTSVANKDQFSLQGTNKKNDGNGVTRSNSIRHDEERNIEIKKAVEHHYMKTTQSFNAKSKRPVDLDSPKVRKKVDPDPYATIARRRSDDIRGFQRNMLAEFDKANYSVSRSRSSSVNSQYTPMLKRSLSVNSSRVPLPRQLSTQGTEKPANKNKKKSVNREATVVKSITTDHLGYNTENVESDVKEIIEDTNSYLQYSNNQESMLEIDEPQIKAEIISQTSNKLDEMEVLEEPGDLDLSFDHEIPSEHYNSEKMEDTSKNFPEVETVETVMEVSPKYPDNNVEVINEKKILEECEATEETSTSESELVPFPPEDISREIDENHEVIDTKYEEISDLCVVSSSNDETEREELCENISIEDEVSKMIVRENIECTEEEKRSLSSDIMSIIEEIAKEVEAARGKYGNGGTWMPKTWKVDYVLQRLIHQLESTDNNQVSKLIQAYESVIQLTMRRVNVTCSQLQLQLQRN